MPIPLPETLIPSLPDDISTVILLSLPLPLLSLLRPVSRSWSHLLHPRRLLRLRRTLTVRSSLLVLMPSDSATPFLFDPLTRAFRPLPPLPVSPYFYGLTNFQVTTNSSHIYLLGGSHFDSGSFPLHRPRAAGTAYRLDVSSPRPAWHRLPDIPHPRGSFACVVYENSIIIAGGGSRHPMFPSDGTRMRSVERFDVGRGCWEEIEPMARDRAGCVGFVRSGEDGEEEMWVMGGYGESYVIGGVVPASVWYRDAVVLGLRSGRWREVGDMWEEGERYKIGQVVVVDNERGVPGVYMLDRNEIFRYDFAANRWWKVSSLRKKVSQDEPCNFVALNGELYVLTSPKFDPQGTPKKRPSLDMQVYDPKKKKWRFLRTTPPFEYPIDLRSSVSCTIQV